MKILVFGATGQTGKQVVSQALKDGHSVTAVVRSPEKITETSDNLKVVKGDVFDEASLTPVMAQHEAVVSCLGFPRKPQPVEGYVDSITAIVGAMQKNNISRIVTMTSWYTDTSSGARAGFIVNRMVIPFLRPVLNGMLLMEQFLAIHTDINYTVVRPPTLKNSSLSGKEMSVVEDFFVKTSSASPSVSRADVAAFMLSCLNTHLHDRKMISVATKK